MIIATTIANYACKGLLIVHNGYLGGLLCVLGFPFATASTDGNPIWPLVAGCVFCAGAYKAAVLSLSWGMAYTLGGYACLGMYYLSFKSSWPQKRQR